jgi:hypothetical protein
MELNWEIDGDCIQISGDTFVDAGEFAKALEGVECRDKRNGKDEPVGKVTNTYVEGGKLKAEVEIGE